MLKLPALPQLTTLASAHHEAKAEASRTTFILIPVSEQVSAAAPPESNE